MTLDPIRPRELVPQARSAVRRNGLSALKSGVAAVVAWQLARWLMPSGADFYAPLVAVLSVQPTVVKTLRDTTQRLSGVGIGLALGFVVVASVGLRWWSLALVMAAAAFVAGWRRLGEQGVQVPIAALLVILLAQQPTQYALELLGEGMIGAITAAAVNLLVVPSLYVARRRQPACRAA